jgi:hypothetical protein
MDETTNGAVKLLNLLGLDRGTKGETDCTTRMGRRTPTNERYTPIRVLPVKPPKRRTAIYPAWSRNVNFCMVREHQ